MPRSFSLKAIAVWAFSARDEAMHEFLGGEIDHAALRLGRGVGDRLQEMRFAESNRGVDIKRIIRQVAPAPPTRHSAPRHKRADLSVRRETREIQPPIEGRTGDDVGVGAFRRLGGEKFAQPLRGEEFGVGRGGFRRWGAAPIALAANHAPAIVARIEREAGQRPVRRANCDGQPLDWRKLPRQRQKQLFRIMRLDPALQEFGWHGETGRPVRQTVEFEAAKPRRKDIVPHVRAQATANPHPRFRITPLLRLGEVTAQVQHSSSS